MPSRYVDGLLVEHVWTVLGCAACGSELALQHVELPLCEPFVTAHVGPVTPIECGLLIDGELSVWRRRCS